MSRALPSNNAGEGVANTKYEIVSKLSDLSRTGLSRVVNKEQKFRVARFSTNVYNIALWVLTAVVTKEVVICYK